MNLLRISLRSAIVFYGTIALIVWMCYWPWEGIWDGFYEGLFNYQHNLLTVVLILLGGIWVGFFLAWLCGLNYYHRASSLRKAQIARLRREVQIYRERLYPGYGREKEQVKQ